VRVKLISELRYADRVLIKMQGLWDTDNNFEHLQDSTDGGILITGDNRGDGNETKFDGTLGRFSWQ
jgi:hypothetical protein